MGLPVPNVIPPAVNSHRLPPETAATKKKNKIADSITKKYQERLNIKTDAQVVLPYKDEPIKTKRASLSWEECVDVCDTIVCSLTSCTVQLRKVLEGVSTNDVPPPIEGGKMFSTETRGKLTGALLYH